jgi:hypothetical protein
MLEDEDLAGETLIEEYQDENYWYKLYDSGLLLQGGKAQTTNGETKIGMYRAFTTTNYSVEIKDRTKPTKYLPSLYKRKVVLDATDDYFDYVCPINKTVHTQGIPNPPITTLKGPNKSAITELVTEDSSVGLATGSLNAIKLKLAVNQFITLKVDIPGAKINDLPSGFTFANSEITGAAKSAGEYRFNIVSEGNSVPVIMSVSNIIRIA